MVLNLWHGTTLARWEAIKTRGLKLGSPLANSLYLPLFFGCLRAETEKDDAVILKVKANYRTNVSTMPGGFAARSAERGDQGKCYETTTVIQYPQIHLVAQIPHEEAVRLYHSKRHKQTFNHWAGQIGLEALV